MHVLLEDEEGRMVLARLRPWDRMRARFLAARLDRELAGGACPEATPSLAARAMRLTSTGFRGDLAASLQAVLESADPRRPQVPVRRARIRRVAPALAELAENLIQPGPVPVRGVAMVSQLLADGGGPLYREACRDDLGELVEQAALAMS